MNPPKSFYNRDSSFIFRIVGIIALAAILMTNYFPIETYTKQLILRFGIFAIVLLSWRYVEDKKRETPSKLNLIFYGFLFLGIFNSFIKLIKVDMFFSLVCLGIFTTGVIVQCLLVWFKKYNLKSDWFLYLVLSLSSFFTVATE
ncbi:MAG: hypothetical protein ACP5FK_07465 [bacterium]